MLCSAAAIKGVSQGDLVREALVEALQDGTFAKASYEAAVTRVVGLRYSLGQ